MEDGPAGASDARRFLQLAGHPLRWQLLRELGRSDRRVGELTALVGEPQNLVSYHLRQLRGGRLVSARRSSADGRDTYYTVDLTHPAPGRAPARPARPVSAPGAAAGRRRARWRQSWCSR